MVLFIMSWKVVQFMTIQVKAMQEHSDELNNYKYLSSLPDHSNENY